jgi:hypothetical protein
MHTYFFAELSVFRRSQHARHKFVRQLLWFVFTSIFIGHMLSVFNPTAYTARTQRQRPRQRQSTTKHKETQSSSPKYPCSGELLRDTKVETRYIEQAIKDAIAILKKCAQCWKLFDSEDPDYAVNLLTRLKQDQVIVIAEKSPVRWILSSDRRLKVIESGKLPGAAGTLDLAGPRTGEMKRPCIYIHPKGFLVTGELADGYGLFGLEPPEQRAVAILHELAHVAGIIQPDEGLTEQGQYKSVANTNCIRVNCISGSIMRPCPGVPLRIKPPRTPPTLNPAKLFDGDGHGSSFRRTKL